jgi:hypothetical protein
MLRAAMQHQDLWYFVTIFLFKVQFLYDYLPKV